MFRFLWCGLVLVSASAVFAQEEGTPPLVADPAGRVRLVRDTGGHTAVPRSLIFTPDRKKLISTGDDRTVQVWDVATRERLRVIRPPVGLDGKGGVRWWSDPVRGGVGQYPLTVDRKGERVAFSDWVNDAKGQLLKTTFICSLATGEARVLKRSGPRDFSADGKVLAIADGKDVNLVEIETDRVIQMAALKNNVVNLAFSPDGKTLAVTAGDANVYLFDAANLKSRKPLTVPGKNNNVRSLGWADDKTLVCRVAGASDNTLYVLDVAKGEVTHTYTRQQLLSPLPKNQKEYHLLELHAQTGTTKALVRTRCKEGDHWLNLSYLFDWSTGEANKGFVKKSHFGTDASAIAPDLSIAADGDAELNDIILWDPKDGKPLKDGKNDLRLRATVRGAKGGPNTIRWRLDGTGFAWEKWEESRGVWLGFHEIDLTTLTVRPLSTQEMGKLGKDNTALVLGSAKPGDWEKQFNLYERGINRSSDPLRIIPHDNGPDLAGNSNPQILKQMGGVCHWDITFVEGKQVANHAWGSNRTEVYDATTGKRLFRSFPTQSYINSWAVSPKFERRYLLIGSADQTLTVYNTATGKVLLTLFPTRTDWIIWTPEGYYAASTNGERLMGWHVENGPDQLASFYPAERFRKQLYRPDVIKLVLEKGSVEEALKAANVALKKEGVKVQEGVADVTKLLPPTVALSVADQSKLPTVTLKVTARAAAKEQPIQSLRLFVDGRPYTEAKGAAALERGVLNWTVELPPGKHQVAVLVRSTDTSGISNEIELDCRDAADKPVMHVLAIGVNEYQDKDLNLSCAANDAQLIADTFRKTCKGELFAEVRTHVLLNKQATRKGIQAAFEELRTDPKLQVKSNDLVVVFFAGHGAKEKEQFYLLTHEADVSDLAHTALSGKQLRDDLKEIPCQVLLMLDACHSGAFGAKGKLSENHLKPATDEATRTFTDDDVGVAVMCAAMGNETAAERGSNGLFTAAVVAALTAHKDVPFNHVNHRQYILHLQTYVFDKVSEESQDQQHPFLHLPWIVQSFPLRQLP